MDYPWAESCKKAMTAAMTQMMTQISGTIGAQMNTVMDQFATDMSSTFSMNPKAFAEALPPNVDEIPRGPHGDAMFSTILPTLETNLRNLGWADINLRRVSGALLIFRGQKDKAKAALDATQQGQ